jgi:hypothetical protein
MSKKFRMLLLCSVVAAFIAFAALLGFFTGGAARPVPLPNPNGYDDFLAAAGLVTGVAFDSWTFEKDELRKFVPTNAEPLRLLHLGLTRTCSVPTDSALTNLAATLNDLPKLKRLAWLLVAEGRLAELENRPADAARSYVDTVRFGNEISRGGFMINRLVGVACESIGGSRLAGLTPKLDCDQVRAVIGDLEKMDDAAVTWDEVRQNEKRFCRYQLRKVLNPIRWVTGTWQIWSAGKLSEQKHNRLVARLRLLTAGLALRCYQTEQGRAPSQLEQLVPSHLRRVPLDPFSGRPLIYRISGTNWLLYSVGPDGVDDGGRPAGRSTSSKGDLLFDSPW